MVSLSNHEVGQVERAAYPTSSFDRLRMRSRGVSMSRADTNLAPRPSRSYPFLMPISLRLLPPIATPLFDAWLGELPPDQRAALAAHAPTIGPLLESAPYLLSLAHANAEWLVTALADTADGAFADIIDIVETLGRTASNEEALAPVLRHAFTLDRGIAGNDHHLVDAGLGSAFKQ